MSAELRSRYKESQLVNEIKDGSRKATLRQRCLLRAKAARRQLLEEARTARETNSTPNTTIITHHEPRDQSIEPLHDSNNFLNDDDNSTEETQHFASNSKSSSLATKVLDFQPLRIVKQECLQSELDSELNEDEYVELMAFLEEELARDELHEEWQRLRTQCEEALAFEQELLMSMVNQQDLPPFPCPMCTTGNITQNARMIFCASCDLKIDTQVFFKNNIYVVDAYFVVVHYYYYYYYYYFVLKLFDSIFLFCVLFFFLARSY